MPEIEPLSLSISQSFTKEQMTRVIKQCSDVKALQDLAIQMLSAWLSQKAATEWVMKQAMVAPPRVSVRDLQESESKEQE